MKKYQTLFLHYRDLIDSTNILKNAHAIISLTEWEEFRNVNWNKIAKEMIPTSCFFDSRSIVNPKKFRDASINLWRIGDGTKNKEIFI